MPVSSRAQRKGCHRVLKRLTRDTLHPGQSTPHPPRWAMTLKLLSHFRGPHGAAGTRPVSPRSEQKGTPNREKRRHPGHQCGQRGGTPSRNGERMVLPQSATVRLAVVLHSAERRGPGASSWESSHGALPSTQGQVTPAASGHHSWPAFHPTHHTPRDGERSGGGRA